MKRVLNHEFREAACDYLLLLSRGYPQKRTLALVADRYRLHRLQRALLYRGVRPQSESCRCRNTLGRNTAAFLEMKSRQPQTGLDLYIDTHNVLNTLMNYLYGRPVFIATDGFLRDCGEAHEGSPDGDGIPERALRLLVRYLVDIRPKKTEFVLDSPVTGSDMLERRIQALVSECLHPPVSQGSTRMAVQADTVLSAVERGERVFIGTSDSKLAARAKAPVIDLARLILQWAFDPEIRDLSRILSHDLCLLRQNFYESAAEWP